MNTVTFQNKGLIDLVSIKTFGISAKDSDDAIGFFGTGLKYAIAILLREGCDITVMRGLEEYSFHVETETVRGKDFQIVCIKDPVGRVERLAFTLELGKTWQLWQAFRELYCNTLDEHGETFGNAAFAQEDWTTITVTGAAFYEEYTNRDKILLMGKPSYIEDQLEIHDKPGGNIHYQGIRVGQFERPSIFTYNLLTHLDLTEDRTIKDVGQVNARIRNALLRSADKELIEKFLTAPADTYEATVDLNWYETPGEDFMDVMAHLPFQKIENGSVLALYRKHEERRKVPEPIKDMSKVEEEQLKKAIDFSTLLDFPVDKYVIWVTDDLSDNVLGMVIGGEIYIARRTFMMGTKMVAATLIEEYLHIEKGFGDCDRPMQNFLFEKMVSMGEDMIGEAL